MSLRERRDDERKPDPPRAPNLGAALRFAVAAYIEEIVLFVLAGVAYVLVVAAGAALVTLVPILIVLAPLLALPTAVLMRLAVTAAHGGMPTWRVARDELGRRAVRKVALAAVQLLLMLLAVTNIALSGDIGGLLGTISALVAGYALIVVSVLAIALWPIVCDPNQDWPLRDQLRMAAFLGVSRSLSFLMLFFLAGLAAIVSVQLIVPATFLPVLVILTIAGYVVPLSEHIRVSRSPPGDR